ncbi:unnamed protein product, partial [Choristocarpus tenellus]
MNFWLVSTLFITITPHPSHFYQPQKRPPFLPSACFKLTRQLPLPYPCMVHSEVIPPFVSKYLIVHHKNELPSPLKCGFIFLILFLSDLHLLSGTKPLPHHL